MILGLADAFVDGDLSRVVVVPGNHDIDWNSSRNAMVAVDDHDIPRDIRRALTEPGSCFRWSWGEQRLYRIVDAAQYTARLDMYWEFVAELYRGHILARQPHPDSDYGLFELDSGRICVAAYNSCATNDCFSCRGEISGEAIAQSILEMRQRSLGSGIRVGVWHHNTVGPPDTSDYMDVDIVRQMMGGGIRLGLHGHQHFAQVTPEYVRLPDSQIMAVVSAGSLCAGHRELPTGSNRQYNLVVISDDMLSARVHIRGRTVGGLFGRLPLQALGGLSYCDVGWNSVPPEVGGARTRKDRVDALVIEAEASFRQNNFMRAVQTLRPVRDRLDILGRGLLIQSAIGLNDWTNAIDFANPPRTIEEAVWLVTAFARSHRYADARRTVARAEETLGLLKPQARDLIAYIEAQEALT